MNYLYILKSEKDGELYIGSTTDLKRRLREHNDGKNFSTQFRRPFELLYYEAYQNLEDARDRERSLKLRGNSRRPATPQLGHSLICNITHLET